MQKPWNTWPSKIVLACSKIDKIGYAMLNNLLPVEMERAIFPVIRKFELSGCPGFERESLLRNFRSLSEGGHLQVHDYLQG